LLPLLASVFDKPILISYDDISDHIFLTRPYICRKALGRVIETIILGEGSGEGSGQHNRIFCGADTRRQVHPFAQLQRQALCRSGTALVRKLDRTCERIYSDEFFVSLCGFLIRSASRLAPARIMRAIPSGSGSVRQRSCKTHGWGPFYTKQTKETKNVVRRMPIFGLVRLHLASVLNGKRSILTCTGTEIPSLSPRSRRG
jgi:hypothetical protein